MPSELNPVVGNAQGVGDNLRGTRGDDLMQGQSGDDVLKGGRGEDRMIGGQGNDVMSGGLDADTFVWSAGHIGDGEVDYITDFSLMAGDMLQFLDSGSADLNVLSVEIQGVEATEANGEDLRNRQTSDNDVVFTIQNSETGATQEIVVLDSWSRGLNDEWEALLADLGLVFGDNTPEEEEEAPELIVIKDELPEFVDVVEVDNSFILG